jgi:hypothetical protein
MRRIGWQAWEWQCGGMGEKAAIEGPSGLTDLQDVFYYGDPEHVGLAAAALQFAEGFLLVQVDPNLDEVELSFTAHRPEALVHWPEASARSMIDDVVYQGVRGLNSAWRWVLRNQQGYDDGFQIELGSAADPVTIQFIAAASSLEVLRVARVT